LFAELIIKKGALFLDVLDKRMEKLGLFYVRFMDDWVVLTPTRWKLRKAVRVVNETLAELQVEQHPDKTFVGRVSRGFWFLGYTFGPGENLETENLETKKAGLTGVAPRTCKKIVERVRQLYDKVRQNVASCTKQIAVPARVRTTDYSLCTFIRTPTLSRSIGLKPNLKAGESGCKR
jgi:hypothetical protein